MANYAIVGNGVVVNLIVWDGDTENWQPPEGSTAVEVPDGVFVSIGYSYDGENFAAPPAPPAPPPTASEVLAQRDVLKAYATSMIDPLSDAVELGEATQAESDSLKAWKLYRIALTRIEQQSGFPANVTWPKAPA